MEQSNKFFKENPGDVIWWVDTSDKDGELLFSFDKKRVFSVFADYPHKLTSQQKNIFDRENPFWAEFFKDRT